MDTTIDNLKAKQEACSSRFDNAMSLAQAAFHDISLAKERWKNAANIQEAISAGVEMLKAEREYSHLVKKASGLHHMTNIYKTLSGA